LYASIGFQILCYFFIISHESLPYEGVFLRKQERNRRSTPPHKQDGDGLYD